MTTAYSSADMGIEWMCMFPTIESMAPTRTFENVSAISYALIVKLKVKLNCRVQNDSIRFII